MKYVRAFFIGAAVIVGMYGWILINIALTRS
jgi:hypothetical protein